MSTKTEEVLENIDKSLASILDGSERILSGVERIHEQLISMDRKLDQVLTTNEADEFLHRGKFSTAICKALAKLIAVIKNVLGTGNRHYRNL